jgi:hypothetical protein
LQKTLFPITEQEVPLEPNILFPIRVDEEPSEQNVLFPNLLQLTAA